MTRSPDESPTTQRFRTNERPGMPTTTRRAAVAGALLAALLPAAACGTDGSASGDDRRSDTSDGDTGTRMVEHQLGRAEVPTEPRRVLALDPYYSLPTALAAGANVVGTSHQPFGEPFPPYVDRRAAADVANVGWFTELDTERILELEPDVIVGLETFVQDNEEQLSKIAPTVALSVDARHWKENLELVGEAIGREDAVARQLEKYESRAASVKERLTRAGPTAEPVSLLNIRAADDLRVYTDNCAAEVLKDVGLTPHLANQTTEEENSVNLTLERITDADADVLFYFVGSAGTNPDSATDARNEITQHRLWNGLRAVRDDQAHQVDARWWFDCGSTQAANRILDDVTEALL